jgi:hypothetical protein
MDNMNVKCRCFSRNDLSQKRLGQLKQPAHQLLFQLAR